MGKAHPNIFSANSRMSTPFQGSFKAIFVPKLLRRMQHMIAWSHMITVG
jgi:hypothetical protein